MVLQPEIVAKFRADTSELKKGIDDITDTTKKSKKELIGFRADLLSVMFSGMALTRVFGGQIDRMKGLVGITPQINALFTEALLDPMIKISDIVGVVTDKFMDMPDSVRSAAGWTMISVQGLGMTLSFIGQAWLGLNGIRDMLSIGIPGAATTGGNALTTFGATGQKAIGSMGAVLKGGIWAVAISIALLEIVNTIKDLQEFNKEAKETLRLKDALEKGPNITVIPLPGQDFQARFARGDVGRETIQTGGPLPGLPGFVSSQEINSRYAMQMKAQIIKEQINQFSTYNTITGNN